MRQVSALYPRFLFSLEFCDLASANFNPCFLPYSSNSKLSSAKSFNLVEGRKHWGKRRNFSFGNNVFKSNLLQEKK